MDEQPQEIPKVKDWVGSYEVSSTADAKEGIDYLKNLVYDCDSCLRAHFRDAQANGRTSFITYRKSRFELINNAGEWNIEKAA